MDSTNAPCASIVDAPRLLRLQLRVRYPGSPTLPQQFSLTLLPQNFSPLPSSCFFFPFPSLFLVRFSLLSSCLFLSFFLNLFFFFFFLYSSLFSPLVRSFSFLYFLFVFGRCARENCCGRAAQPHAPIVCQFVPQACRTCGADMTLGYCHCLQDPHIINDTLPLRFVFQYTGLCCQGLFLPPGRKPRLSARVFVSGSCSKCYGMDCFGTYFTHVQSCNVTRACSRSQDATQEKPASKISTPL